MTTYSYIITIVERLLDMDSTNQPHYQVYGIQSICHKGLYRIQAFSMACILSQLYSENRTNATTQKHNATCGD